MTLSLDIDHIGVVVADLEAARQAYDRLGFRLTPRSPHEGRLTPDGPVEIWGTGNHCAMFRRGYLELLGITDPSRHHQHVRDRLDRYQGVQLVALGCRDAEAVRARWAETAAGLRPVTPIGRAVPQAEGGTRPATFRIVYLDDHFPEAMLFAIEHENPEALWQPELLDQPNGVTAVSGVTVVSDEPQATAARLTAIGLDGAATEGGWRAHLGKGGYMDILSPEEARRRFPGETPPAVPSILAASVAVGDLGATARHLERAGVPARADGRRIRVPARAALGCVIDFETTKGGGSGR